MPHRSGPERDVVLVEKTERDAVDQTPSAVPSACIAGAIILLIVLASFGFTFELGR